MHLAHVYDCVCRVSMQIMLTLFIAIGGGLVAAFLSYHLALTAAGLTTYEVMKQQQAIPALIGGDVDRHISDAVLWQQ